jgi:replication-associated recombination protein RarA
MLDRDEDEVSPYEKLHSLIGLDIVKKKIDCVLASDVVEKERKKRKGKDYQAGSMHMIFGGNPGNAKTTVAKLFAGIAKEKGVIKSGICVERGGMDLDGLGCVGAIREAFTAAKGGVLFIDEAYTLSKNAENDYGQEAIDTLLKRMEDDRNRLVVIIAGYTNEIKNFVNSNPGLSSRFNRYIEFPDYTEDELAEIFKSLLSKYDYKMDYDAEVAMKKCIAAAVQNKDSRFGNGRYVRNLFEKVIEKQANRLAALSDLGKADVSKIIASDFV